MNLCLGTVQFGMQYGIQGGQRPTEDEVFKILAYAADNNVSAIDTASAYGNAEEILGKAIKNKILNRDATFITTKCAIPSSQTQLDDCYTQLRNALIGSLSRLHTDHVDAFICHTPIGPQDNCVAEAFQRLKKEGLALNVGASIYEPAEALSCIADNRFSIIQIPFSLFDQRMKDANVLKAAASRSMIIHSRSAFVQGLILMNSNAIPDYLAGIRPYIVKFESLCRETGYSPRALALGYVKAQPEISHLVFGVDNLKQLREIITDFSTVTKINDDLAKTFSKIPEELIMPNKWRHT